MPENHLCHVANRYAFLTFQPHNIPCHNHQEKNSSRSKTKWTERSDITSQVTLEMTPTPPPPPVSWIGVADGKLTGHFSRNGKDPEDRGLRVHGSGSAVLDFLDCRQFVFHLLPTVRRFGSFSGEQTGPNTRQKTQWFLSGGIDHDRSAESPLTLPLAVKMSPRMSVSLCLLCALLLYGRNNL